MRSVSFFIVLGRCLLSQYKVGACTPVSKDSPMGPGMRLGHFPRCFVQQHFFSVCHSTGFVPFSWCYFGTISSVFILVLDLCIFRILCRGKQHTTSGIPMIAPSLAMSLLPWAFAPLTGYVLFLCFCSACLPILACGRRTRHFVLSVHNQNPRLDSICGDTAELEVREPLMITPPDISKHWHWTW